MASARSCQGDFGAISGQETPGVLRSDRRQLHAMPMTGVRGTVFWVVLGVAIVLPIALTALSPLYQWRGPVYIGAGFAGVLALALLLIQPLLAMGWLPGVHRVRSRRLHAWFGAVLTGAVALHVAGLWITSPPDVIDALLFRSPTPFSLWGVIAMWCVFAAALVAAFRRRLRLRPWVWRLVHLGLVTIVVGTTVAHALLIEGAMEWYSKVAFCVVLVGVVIAVLLKVWRR